MSSVFKDYLLHQNNNNAQQNTSGNSQQTVDSREGNEQLTLVKQFQNMNPTSFKGVPDPNVAESWVKKLEKMFKLLKCTDEQKVELAVFTLEGEADDWWISAQDGFSKRGEKQDDMTVHEYQAKFNSLVKFAPYFVNDETRKAREFQKRLKASIRNKVVPQMLKTYDEPQTLDCVPMVNTHSKEVLTSKTIYRSCRVMVEGRVLLANLILLGIVNFDVILGMDWLSTHYAMVDCYEKVVTFSAPNQPVIRFEGEKLGSVPLLVSCMQADKMLQHECYGYLAYVFESKKKPVFVKGIRVVEDFPDVFPKELPGLSPDKEIEFIIDLVPGTSPISQQPYKMALVELIELKK
ncbi:hypothetical protein SLEP1_g34473 [Rubroshorea leprosula]|uniref:Gag-pol polyprotein n=1 Tax=Rubroshorea leprosula TaxID=152421 RepID=A0AAV5KJZ6_9ROSI|nr:hypothetical protein SLEP1_g34473 [Rubroshorea leprosula]